jgi:hypothetical protein
MAEHPEMNISDYVVATESLERLYRGALAAVKERDELIAVVRRIGSETVEPDALLAQQNILRIVNQTMRAWEARRG